VFGGGLEKAISTTGTFCPYPGFSEVNCTTWRKEWLAQAGKSELDFSVQT
jgi:hypothetical protein